MVTSNARRCLKLEYNVWKRTKVGCQNRFRCNEQREYCYLIIPSESMSAINLLVLIITPS